MPAPGRPTLCPLAHRPTCPATHLPCCSSCRPCCPLQGPAGIIVDAGGSPVGSALPLEGLGATPRALAPAGAFLLVVSEAAIHVFDRLTGAEVQRLAFATDLRPLPGQPLYAAAAGDGQPGQPAGLMGHLGAAPTSAPTSAAAGCVAVAGRRVVWICLPVSPADQARELLGQRDYGAALELIQAGLAQGAAWAQVAAAQAALLLLHGESQPAAHASSRSRGLPFPALPCLACLCLPLRCQFLAFLRALSHVHGWRPPKPLQLLQLCLLVHS